MGQKTSPIGFRTGITRGWESTWFASKQDYGTFLVEDQKIRKFIDAKYNKQMPKGGVAKVEIVRTRNEVTVTLHSARPGVVIGPRGGEVDKLREELETLTGRKVMVNVIEIKEPDLNAFLVGDLIAEQLCKRAAFRRAMKQACEAAMNAGAKGIKILCSGRLAGAEIARRETQKMGSIPLHTLDADVDYATARAETTYGTIGIKVWIHKGKFGEVLEARQQRRRRPFRREDVSGGEVSGGRRGYQRAGRSATPTSAVPPPAAAQPPVEPPPQENPQGS
ncbi:MAG: 30S ribosomal protein S3 [Sedimentisphaerales bacterium]